MPTVPLDPQQSAAVAHATGPCLVVAGPGSGKTRVIVERFLTLLESGSQPDELLVLTYTNKAAQEMRERVETARGAFAGDSPLTTFHSFSGRVLREWGWLIGISPAFRIADDAERWLHMEAVLSDLKPRTLWNPLRPHDQIYDLLKLLATAKQELITPERYVDWAREARPGVTDDTMAALLDRHVDCAAVYAALQDRYRRLAVLDHEDTILHAEELLRLHGAARHAISERITHVMVDEYQDTNVAQAHLVETLVAGHRNVLVVADDDQAIYKFRGASLANLDRFATTYPDHARVTLTVNYRSTPEIVAAATAIIGAADPATRLPKELVADRESGGAAEIWDAVDEVSEADAVARECARLVDGGMRPSSMALLFRRHSDMQPAIAAMNAHGVPHRVHGGRGFFMRPEIKDMLALLTAIADIRDSQAVLRCLLMPVWQVSSKGRVALVAACDDNDTPLIRLLESGEPLDGVDDNDLAAARRCAVSLTELHADAGREDVRDLFHSGLEMSGYLGVLDLEDEAARRQMGANLNKFGELLENFADWSDDRRVATALHYLTVLRESGVADELAATDAADDGVVLLTAHAAKGLEWPVVFLSSCIEMRWPGRGGFGARLTLPDDLVPEKVPSGDSHVDEERRLFYVAATRARDRLVFTVPQRTSTTFSNQTESQTPFLRPLQATAERSSIEPLATMAPRRQKRAKAGAEGRLRISVSDIAVFKACPRRFEYRRRYKMPVRTGVPGWYGTMVHEVLQVAGVRRRAGEVVDGEAAAALWHEAWDASSGPKGRNAELRQTGEDQLRRYCASDAWTKRDIEHVESKFTLPVPAVDVTGRFDRIDRMPGGALTVVDYKTGPPRDAEQLAKDLQVRAYAVAASQIEKADDITVELHYLQTAEVVRVDLSREHLDRAFKNISATGSEVLTAWRSNDFPAKPSAWNCGGCDYRVVCDESRNT